MIQQVNSTRYIDICLFFEPAHLSFSQLILRLKDNNSTLVHFRSPVPGSDEADLSDLSYFLRAVFLIGGNCCASVRHLAHITIFPFCFASTPESMSTVEGVEHSQGSL